MHMLSVTGDDRLLASFFLIALGCCRKISCRKILRGVFFRHAKCNPLFPSAGTGDGRWTTTFGFLLFASLYRALRSNRALAVLSQRIYQERRSLLARSHTRTKVLPDERLVAVAVAVMIIMLVSVLDWDNVNIFVCFDTACYVRTTILLQYVHK